MTNLELVKELISMIEPKTEMDSDIKKAAVALLAKESPEPKKKPKTQQALWIQRNLTK